jgi:glycosyltransferase involved in cell wall biosynthesis
MSMPRVSVIIPAFNQGQYLSSAIDSALNQTHRDVEVVVVDDGSTDGTGDVLPGYERDRRVRILRQTNSGVGTARNNGFNASTGSLVCFLDADDYYHPDRLARQIATFAESPGVGFAYCDIVRVDAKGAVADDYEVGRARQVTCGDIFESLLQGGYFPPHTVILRREIFERSGGFDPALGGHADLDLWLRLAGDGVHADFLPEKLAYYRLHDNSMSRDETHMRNTRRLALEKAVRAHPDRAAAALSALQNLGHDLHAANGWLKERLAEYRPYVEDESPWFTYDFVERVGDGRLNRGNPDAAAAWDVRMNGEATRALLLHPPATMTFALPDCSSGVLRGAVGLHPDVWARTGPTAFEVFLDGYPVFKRVVDPRNAAHRRWLQFEIDVPATSTPHSIAFATDALETRAHQWALWRSLRYFRTTERSAR